MNMPLPRMLRPRPKPKAKKTIKTPRKLSLSQDGASYFVLAHSEDIQDAFTELQNRPRAMSATCCCQEHLSGHVPPIPMFEPFNQRGRKHIASAVARQLDIGCEGKTAAQRQACLRSQTYPCLTHH